MAYNFNRPVSRRIDNVRHELHEEHVEVELPGGSLLAEGPRSPVKMFLFGVGRRLKVPPWVPTSSSQPAPLRTRLPSGSMRSPSKISPKFSPPWARSQGCKGLKASQSQRPAAAS